VSINIQRSLAFIHNSRNDYETISYACVKCIVLSVVITNSSFPHSWRNIGFVTRVTRGEGTAYPSGAPVFTSGF